MTQEDLLDYLKVNECIIKRQDKKGYYIVENTTNNKLNGVPVPKTGEHLMPVTICQICNNLGVEIPDCAKDVHGLIKEIKSNHGI